MAKPWRCYIRFKKEEFPLNTIIAESILLSAKSASINLLWISTKYEENQMNMRRS